MLQGSHRTLCCSARDLAGFVFGMASILCWLVAQVPQFITNIKRQRADASSPWFLAEWLLVSIDEYTYVIGRLHCGHADEPLSLRRVTLVI